MAQKIERLLERHEALREAVEEVRARMATVANRRLSFDDTRNHIRSWVEALATDEPEAPAPGGGELVTAEVLSRCEDHRAAPEANCPNCQPTPAKEKPVSVYCGECRGHFLPPHEHEEAKSDGSM